MASGINEYLAYLKEGIERPGEFTPHPHYCPDADALYFYARDVPSYAKRLNPFVTLFLASEDETLVGVKLKSVRRIVSRLERLNKNMNLVVIDHKIKLGILLALALVAPAEDPSLESYEDDLVDSYEDVEVDSDELIGAGA